MKTRAQHADNIRSKDAQRIAAQSGRWKRYLDDGGPMTLAEFDRLLGT
jgi:hypothetical protein